MIAYEEDKADYKCKGESSRFIVIVCALLVTLIVCLKMLSEERRAICQRIVLIRHATENSYYYSIYHVIFGEKRLRALKLLLLCVFQSFREYGVLTFVYVAAVEQIMLFDTILDYVINSVIVLVIAELDELVFKSIVRIELEEHDPAHKQSFDVTEEEAEKHEEQDRHSLIPAFLPSVDIEASIRPSVFQHRHHDSPENIKEMISLSLNPTEYEVYTIFDYFIVRLNFVMMLLPLLNGKITGHNCSENSLFRVSEIAMCGLFCIRILLNIFIDVKLQVNRGKWQNWTDKSYFSLTPLVLWSLLEHSIPCVAYVALMYYVLVRELKPAH